jgi:hypothetical protein
MATSKKQAQRVGENAIDDEPRVLPAVAWLNQFLVGVGENLPNHALTAMGRGKFVVFYDPNACHRIVIRTKQEAYRLVAWLLLQVDLHALPDELPTDSVTGTIIEAADPYTYDEIEAAIYSTS